MATNKKPRRPYKPKWAKVNTLELVADRIKPVEKQSDWYMERMLKTSAAMEALLKGQAVRPHISDLVAAHNMAVAMQKYKTGDEYRDITNQSADVLVAITQRFGKVGRYVATGPELNILRDLIELHQEQLRVCTVGEVQKAYEYAVRVRRSNAGTTLNTRYIPEPQEVQGLR